MEQKNDASRWIRCPVCRSKTRTKVYEDTMLLKFPLYCPMCKTEVRVDVLNFRMRISENTGK